MNGCDVIVTGAQGFIGQALVERLGAGGEMAVVGVDRADVDLADRVDTRRFLEGLQPRKIVHLAASLHRDASSESHEAQWRDTFAAGRNVIELAGELGVEHLLLAGSADELGDQAGILGTELPPRPITVYGLCKSLLRELADFHARAGATRIDWFRPFHVYGVGQRGSSVIAYACEAAAGNQPAQFTDGTQSRDFVYIDDIVDWLVAGVGGAAGGPPGKLGLYHLGTGVATAVRDVLAAIAGELPSASFELGALPRRPREPDCQIALAPEPRAGSPWPWAPRVSVAEGIARTAAWWRVGGPGR